MLPVIAWCWRSGGGPWDRGYDRLNYGRIELWLPASDSLLLNSPNSATAFYLAGGTGPLNRLLGIGSDVSAHIRGTPGLLQGSLMMGNCAKLLQPSSDSALNPPR